MKRFFIFLFFFVASANAQTVQNPSFETVNPLTISGSGSYNHGPIPGWTGTGGSWQPTIAAFSQLCDGKVVAFTGGTLTQDLGVASPGTYTLKVCTGLRADASEARDSLATWTITLSIGTWRCSSNGLNSAIPVGTFVQQTLTCATPAVLPQGDLTVSIASSGGAIGAEAVFDDVILTFSSPSHVLAAVSMVESLTTSDVATTPICHPLVENETTVDTANVNRGAGIQETETLSLADGLQLSKQTGENEVEAVTTNDGVLVAVSAASKTITVTFPTGCAVSVSANIATCQTSMPNPTVTVSVP